MQEDKATLFQAHYSIADTFMCLLICGLWLTVPELYGRCAENVLGKENPNIMLVSACDDSYVPLLLDMLASLGSKIKSYELGIIELNLSDSEGLSSENKQKILSYKPDCHFVKSRWFLDIPAPARTMSHKSFQTKPFIADLFSGYDGYVYIDADVWFADAGAVEDYISAGEKHGIAIAAESHPLMGTHYRVKHHKIFGFTVARIIKSYSFNVLKAFFGRDVAFRLGLGLVLNSGLFYMRADSPAWRAWAGAMELSARVLWGKRGLRLCDQTCLQYALEEERIPYTLMALHYNWTMGDGNIPILDRANRRLLDPVYPHLPIKAIHTIADTGEREYQVPSTDGDSLKTHMTYAKMGKLLDIMD